MDLLFKTSQVGNNGEKVVSYSNFKAHYSGVNDNLSWSSLEPSIRKATAKYIRPVIGAALYDDIAEKYQAGTALSDVQAEFLEKLQDVTAYYTIYHGAPELNISISDMGMGEKGAAGSAMYPTSQWRYKTFMWDLCRKADELMDALILFLDAQVLAGEAYFDLWKDAAEYQENKTAFFNSAALLSRYQNINNSRRLFNAMYQDILDAESKVKVLICTDQFDDLATKINEGTLSTDESVLVDNIRRYVAARAVAKSVPRLTVYLDGQGLFLSSYDDGYESKSSHASAFKGAEAVGGFVAKVFGDAEFYFESLINYVYANIDTFTLIKNSTCYEEYNPVDVMPVCVGDGGVMI